MGTTATSGLSGSSSRSCKNPRNAPAHSARTTSLTLTANRFFTRSTSSKFSWASAMLRSAVISALNNVEGAVKGAAMAAPLRARPTVLTIVEAVVGNAFARSNGR